MVKKKAILRTCHYEFVGFIDSYTKRFDIRNSLNPVKRYVSFCLAQKESSQI